MEDFEKSSKIIKLQKWDFVTYQGSKDYFHFKVFFSHLHQQNWDFSKKRGVFSKSYENRIFLENVAKPRFSTQPWIWGKDFGTIISVIIILFELKYEWSLFLVSFQHFWLILVQNNSKLTNWDQNMLSSAQNQRSHRAYFWTAMIKILPEFPGCNLASLKISKLVTPSIILDCKQNRGPVDYQTTWFITAC